MSSILHRWDDKGVCQFCGVKVLDVSVNGGLFCAGSAEGRKKPDIGTDTPGPAAAGVNSGGFGFYGIRPGPAPGAPPPTGGAQGTTSGSASPTPQAQAPQGAHDWDSAGFCKLCRLGMYAVKQLKLPCRPVPQGMTHSLVALPQGAYGGHLFDMALGRCVHCGYHQHSLSWFDMDCPTAQRSGPPPQPYANHQTVAPFTADTPQDVPAKSPYLIQQDCGQSTAARWPDHLTWADASGQCWARLFWNPSTKKMEWERVDRPFEGY